MATKRTTTSDSPKVHFAWSQFDDAEVETFVFMTDANKRVEFPDLFSDSFDADEGEKLLYEAQSGQLNTGEIIRRWLPEDDSKLVLKLGLRRRAQLITAAIAHYEKYLGDPGEDTASES